MIETRDLSVSIGTREILRDVDLRLMPGQITGLVGESGSGKSMAALSVIGLLPPGMQAVSRANPFFYMIDGFRAGFIGVAEAPLWLGAAIVGGLCALLWALAYSLLKSGWKLRA